LCTKAAIAERPGRPNPRFRTNAPFGDFTRLVKHMRFPTQTRESPHFRASTRAIVKPFLVGAYCDVDREGRRAAKRWRFNGKLLA